MSEQALRRVDWDFSQVPERELHACMRYEYAREIEDYITYFEVDPKGLKHRAKWNKEHPTPEFHLEEDSIWVRVIFPQIDDCLLFDSIPHEYPSCAWQDISPKMRERIVWLLNAKTSGVMTVGLHSPFFSPAEETAFAAALGKQIVQLSIDWKQSDAALLFNFRDWLEQNRPKERRVKAQRGRLSFRDDLNALSALRLRHHHTASDAAAVTTKVLGKPLYAQAFGWERAAGGSVEVFKRLFPKAKGPVSSKLVENPRGRPRSMKDVMIEAMNKAL